VRRGLWHPIGEDTDDALVECDDEMMDACGHDFECPHGDSSRFDGTCRMFVKGNEAA
jgi:hypothetical protein